jgi:arsenate reductase
LKTKILFVCIHNSARSQIAEALINKFYGDKFIAESAGIEPGKLNPLVVKSLKEIGIDISNKPTRSVNEVLQSRKEFDYVITVCEKEAADKCPIFPGKGEKIQWSFPDPSKFIGTDEEKLKKIREVRIEIYENIKKWIKAYVNDV